MKQNFKKLNKGITLVALVITIILLLILAGISIATLTGSGLFEKAKMAEQKSKEGQELEDSTLKDYENKIGNYINGTRTEKEEESKAVTAWEGTNNNGTVSLGDYKISDYDFILLTTRQNAVDALQTQLISTNCITIGTTIIGASNESQYIWYTVTEENTLTYYSGNNTLSLIKVELINL